MNIPSPQECGLPPKFSQWRANQEQSISVMITPGKRVRAICAPTGFGKTACYMAAALLSNEPTCIVTDSRGLQNQLMSDYESIGLVDIRGKRNYACDLKPGYTCEEGYAARCPYKGTVGCPSSQAEMRAATSRLVVTNYNKWTSARKYGSGMNHFKQVIFDEAHSMPAALERAMQVTLNSKEMEETLNVPFPIPSEATEFAVWKNWAVYARAVVEVEVSAAQARISGVDDPKQSWVKHYTHMRNLCRRLAILSTARPSDWIVEEIETGYQFDPIRPAKYAEAALLLRVPKIIAVSATLRPKTMYMVGVGKENFHFQEFDSDFDPRRCPIYYVPAMRVDKYADDLRMLWVKLDQIAARRRDRKGIVHTISYARRDDVIASSRFASSMIINPRGEAPSEIIEQFRRSPDGTILVSPSVGTGYDFPRRQAEWQFICKIPFPPPSKILKARTDEDKEYPYYLTMQTLVQTFGRIMRDKTDQGENFIADSHMEWFKPRYGHLAPRSFHGFYKEMSVLPQPPERLKS